MHASSFVSSNIERCLTPFTLGTFPCSYTFLKLNYFFFSFKVLNRCMSNSKMTLTISTETDERIFCWTAAVTNEFQVSRTKVFPLKKTKIRFLNPFSILFFILLPFAFLSRKGFFSTYFYLPILKKALFSNFAPLVKAGKKCKINQLPFHCWLLFF